MMSMEVFSMTNSRTFRRRLVALLVALCTLPVVAQAQRPTVFIGPQVRDGFLDMDAGIRDSIQDLQARAREVGFRVVPRKTMSLLLERSSPSDWWREIHLDSPVRPIGISIRWQRR